MMTVMQLFEPAKKKRAPSPKRERSSADEDIKVSGRVQLVRLSCRVLLEGPDLSGLVQAFHSRVFLGSGMR